MCDDDDEKKKTLTGSNDDDGPKKKYNFLTFDDSNELGHFHSVGYACDKMKTPHGMRTIYLMMTSVCVCVVVMVR